MSKYLYACNAYSFLLLLVLQQSFLKVLLFHFWEILLCISKRYFQSSSGCFINSLKYSNSKDCRLWSDKASMASTIMSERAQASLNSNITAAHWFKIYYWQPFFFHACSQEYSSITFIYKFKVSCCVFLCLSTSVLSLQMLCSKFLSSKFRYEYWYLVYHNVCFIWNEKRLLSTG